MRTRFDALEASSPTTAWLASSTLRSAGRRLVQLGTLAYWLPCLTVDVYVLWGWRGDPRAYVYTFQALTREAVVFLGLWFVVGAVQAVVGGGRRERRPGARLARPTPKARRAIAASALGRDHRGLG